MKKLVGISNIKPAKDIFFIPANLKVIIVLLLTMAASFFLSYSLEINFIIVLFLPFLFIYTRFLYKENPYFKGQNILYLILLFVIIFVSSYFILNRGHPVLFIPFVIGPMLTVLLFNDIVAALLLTIGLSVSIALLAGNNLLIGILFLISGLVSSMLVFGARKRSTIIHGGLIIGLIQALLLFFIEGFRITDSTRYIIIIVNGIVSSIIVLGITPIFEYLSNTITNISLLELADFHHPLLNRMILEAPGTYHHSLVVGNLSEVACEVVGANSLLARVGAYYHDLGKLGKPEYFSENQAIKTNKHELLPANMSKMIIINHVKEGVELAKSYRINPRLIDFIQQHHGTGLVYYFYRRALESLEEDQDIKEEGFRYPGPKPKTKETAVVLLADSVEAATRALKDPDATKIEEVVHKVINNKFIDGQLDECELTLKDLEKISQIFIRILTGIYHSRITYPDEQSIHSSKKSTKENNHSGNTA